MSKKAAYRCLRWLALYHNKFFHLKHVRSCLHFHVSIFLSRKDFWSMVGRCHPVFMPSRWLRYFVGSYLCLQTIGSYFSLKVLWISPCRILQILFNYLQLCCGHQCQLALERAAKMDSDRAFHKKIYHRSVCPPYGDWHKQYCTLLLKKQFHFCTLTHVLQLVRKTLPFPLRFG